MEQTPQGWQRQGHRLVRDIVFDDYSKVVLAGVAVSLLAIWRDHHPRLVVDYHRLGIELWSHDVDDVTDRDRDLAQWINAMLPPTEGPRP
jgi:4a-hydroxytetrahydrobiopterin dehydratase